MTIPASGASTLHTLRGSSWHRGLLWLAAAMGVLTLATLIASFVDTREVTGVELWLKPLKFSVSVGVYALTLSWLIGKLKKWRRIGWIAGTIATIGLAIEMIIIVGVAAVGDTSHFNVSTPLHTALWAVMAVSIVIVWVMTFVVALALFRNPLGDRATSLAIRAGVLLAVVGMGLAFLMTGPTASQLDNYQGIVGAHTVGVPDGGPGLPLLGWSTASGDLRIPHFVGMHALQVLPLLLIAVELLSRRWSRLADPVVRLRLVWIAIGGYAAVLATLTAQALVGQSVVSPSGGILFAFMVIALALVASIVAALATGRRREAVVPSSGRAV
jgi:hypothetical protein